MIKIFCDICKKEIPEREEFSSGSTLRISPIYNIEAKLLMPENLHACKHCIIDLIKEKDDMMLRALESPVDPESDSVTNIGFGHVEPEIEKIKAEDTENDKPKTGNAKYSKQFSPEVSRQIKLHCRKTGRKQSDIAKEIGMTPVNFNKMLTNCSGKAKYVDQLLDIYREITSNTLISEANC